MPKCALRTQNDLYLLKTLFFKSLMERHISTLLAEVFIYFFLINFKVLTKF